MSIKKRRNMMDFEESFSDYKNNYETQTYNENKVQNEYELTQLDYNKLTNDGSGLEVKLTISTNWEMPEDTSRYLWIMAIDSVRYKNEFDIEPKPKHTNLTGGEEAYCGGEMWFYENTQSVAINGASGRYPPRSEEELQKFEESMRNFGYNVTSFGWDYDVDLPARELLL